MGVHAGEIAPLVVGGNSVKASEWIGTRTVALQKNGSTICSATTLSSKVALTAAHCVDNGKTGYRLSFGVDSESSRAPKRTISKIVIHPNYRGDFSSKNPSDLAIVFFSGGLPSNYKSVVVVGEKEVPKRGSTVTIAGYGTNKRNRIVGVGKLRKAELTVLEASLSESEVMLAQKNSKAGCYGDSGGPVYMKNEAGEMIQLGVASYVTTRPKSENDQVSPCGDEIVYTRVGYFLKWIRDEIAKQ